MGCVSSNLLNREEDFGQLGSSALGQHVVSLTSTTYGLLSLDPTPPPHQTPSSPPPRRFTFGSILSSPLLSDSRSSQPEVINSWELMAGLDADSFRFPPLPSFKPSQSILKQPKDNSNNPNCPIHRFTAEHNKPFHKTLAKPSPLADDDHGFDENRCPPKGENRVVVYTTSLRSVRKTFEACNAVVAAIEALGFWVCQRDISMDRGFKEELRELMNGKESGFMLPPRVFVRGVYVGGAEEVLRFAEQGILGDLLEGLPKIRAGAVCEGCGGTRFLPCFRCYGSCKMVFVVKGKIGEKQRSVAVRCPDCNENGLVLCPICS